MLWLMNCQTAKSQFKIDSSKTSVDSLTDPESNKCAGWILVSMWNHGTKLLSAKTNIFFRLFRSKYDSENTAQSCQLFKHYLPSKLPENFSLQFACNYFKL